MILILIESNYLQILYPSTNENRGLVLVGFMGPNSVTEYRKFRALNILLSYLTDSSVSPLQMHFIEIDDPFASKVSFITHEYSESLIIFSFENVPIQKMDGILEKLKEILNKLSTGEEKIGMERMKSIIEKDYLKTLCALENDPQKTLGYILMQDSVYGIKEADVSFEYLMSYYN